MFYFRHSTSMSIVITHTLHNKKLSFVGFNQECSHGMFFAYCICISRIYPEEKTDCIGQFRFTVRMRKAFLFLAVLALSKCQDDPAPLPLVELGSFRDTTHGVSGQVFKADDSTIKIKMFNYDGNGKLIQRIV